MADSIWTPAIYRPDFESGQEMFYIPQLVLKCEISRQVNQKESKIPLLEELPTYGLTNSFRSISMSGAFDVDTAYDDGEEEYIRTTTRDELDQIRLMKKMDRYCGQYDVDPGDGFELILAYDPGETDACLKFIDVVCVEFKWDMGDDVRIGYTWSAQFVARKPNYYEAAPGAGAGD